MAVLYYGKCALLKHLNSTRLLFCLSGDSISDVMWHSRRLCMSRPRRPGEQQRSPPPVHWLSTQGACWETILLYMLLIRGPFHSHRTPTYALVSSSNSNNLRGYDTQKQTTNQTNTSTTGFAKDMKWKFYEWLMAIATIDVVKLRLKQAWTDSFVFLCLLSLIIICKVQPWQCCFHVEPEEKIGGKGKMQLLFFDCSQNGVIPIVSNQDHLTKVNWWTRGPLMFSWCP